jgi:hypothetical protein
MKKVLLLSLLLSILLISFVSAKDVAYIVKTSENSNIVSVLNNLGYSYDVIHDSDIPSANFSNYALLLIQDDVVNKNYLNLNSTNTLFIVSDISNNVVNSAWKDMKVSQLSLRGVVEITFNSLGNQFTEGFPPNLSKFTAYYPSVLSKNLYTVKRKMSTSTGITGVAHYGSNLDSVVAYSNSSNKRKVFFGIPDVNSWTTDTQKLFSNSLKWVRLGTDFDGDGFYSDSDCNDTNKNVWQNLSGYRDADGDGFGAGSLVKVCAGNSLPSGYSSNNLDCNDQNSGIKPGAAEIPYNHIDEDCNGYDLADVDGDGYCKKDYLIQNIFLQCANETGSWGRDCNDQNSSIYYGAPEGFNKIDTNCMAEAPVLISNISDLSWNEDEPGSVINLSEYFKSKDGNQITYSAYIYGGGILMNMQNGIANFSSLKDWNGNAKIVFRAYDPSLLSSLSNNLTINVLAVNDAPVMRAILPSQDIKNVEGYKFIIEADAQDIDSTNLNYSVNDSRFSRENNLDNVFSWQTGYDDAGIYYFNVSVTDGFLMDSRIVKISVIPKLLINEIALNPVSGSDWVEVYNPRNADVNLTGCYLEDIALSRAWLHGVLASKSFSVADWNGELNKSGSTIKIICSGVIVDRVTYGGEGNIPLPELGESVARIPDGNDTGNSSDWRIMEYPTRGVSNEADVTPPVVSLTIPENNTLINTGYVLFNFTASDNQAASLNCSLYSDVSGGGFRQLASQSIATRALGNFYANGVSDGTYRWQVKCSDGLNLGSSELRKFTVDKPDAPVLKPIQDITVNETDLVTITANASDVDLGDVLNYSISDSRFSQAGNIFTWQTGYNDSGVYYFNVSVSDGIFNVSQRVKITVINENRAPLSNYIENITFSEDSATSIILTEYFSDPDGDALSYNAAGNSSITLSVFNGVATLIPKLNWNGIENIVFGATDTGGLSNESNIIMLNITPINDAPVLKPIQDITVNETDLVTITANASDVDLGDVLNYSISDSRFSQAGNIFTWQTGYNDSGVYYFNVSVSDGLLSDSRIVKIIVGDVNQLPVVFIEPVQIDEDSGVHYVSINASDPDGEGFGVQLRIINEAGLNCSLNSGILSFEPLKNVNGNAWCTIEATDSGNGTTEFVFNVTILAVNDAPNITSFSPVFNPLVAENGKQEFSVTFSDIDTLPPSLVSVEWFVDDVLVGNGSSYELNPVHGNHSIKVVVNDSQLTDERQWNLSAVDKPVASNYNGSTTDFSQVSDLSNTDLILEKEGTGRIQFLEPVNLTNQVDFNYYSAIDSGLVAIDTNYFSGMAGKLASITLYNLNFSKTPVIYYSSGFELNRSGITQPCPPDKCMNISYAQGTLNFLASFSSFRVGDTLSCSEQSGFICSSNEFCAGKLLNAVEDRCCSQQCTEIPPEFNDAETCSNLSDKIELTISSPESGKEFKVGENITLKVNVKNNGEDGNFDLKAYLYDITEDSAVKEAEDSVSIDKGDRENVKFSFEIPDAIDESNQYALYVFATDDNEDFCNQKFAKISINRESDRVVIKEIRLEDGTVCGGSIEASIDLKNIGKHGEDVVLSIENPELKISEKTDEFRMEKNRKTVTKLLDISIPDDAKPGVYKLNVKAEFKDKEVSETKTLSVECKKEQVSKVILTAAKSGDMQLESQVKTTNPSLLLVYLFSVTLVAISAFLILIAYAKRRKTAQISQS